VSTEGANTLKERAARVKGKGRGSFSKVAQKLVSGGSKNEP